MKEDIAREAYVDLFGKEPNYSFSVSYSGRFSKYNAKVTMSYGRISFYLSKDWKDVHSDIQKGLMQDLLKKLFKSKRKTMCIDLYHNFIKSLDKYDTGSYQDQILLDSFNRVNDRFFDSNMDMPHLKWSRKNLTQLGSYNFHTNTLRISSIFKEDLDLLDYVMYHELLHKDMKYDHTKSSNHFHTSEFRRRERMFSNEDYEKKLKNFLKKFK